ncbi:MAG: hypothetical protein IPK07_27695 [Deltaproteobacteria bacterium]|nr:hypothetical protein [Deltaproteobacteria bacterium]
MSGAAREPSSVAITRRRLLRWGVGGTLLLGVGSLVWRARRAPLAEPAWAAGPWKVLSRVEAVIVAAVAARLLDPGDAENAAAPDLLAVTRFFDRFLHLAHPEVRRDLRALLGAFDGVGPLSVGLPGRFVNLPLDEQARVLVRWERGPHPMRMGFTALKQLSFMAHYGRDATWPALGYDGPIVPRGYAGGEGAWFDPAWAAADGDDLVGADGRRRKASAT